VGTEVAEVDTAGRDRAKELFREVVEYHGFEIEEMEVAADHVHIFISFPPKYSISKVVGILKAVSARGDTEGVSESEEGVMGRGVLGGRVLCAESGGRSDSGSDQEIHAFSRTKGEESGAVAVVLKSPVLEGRGFLLERDKANRRPRFGSVAYP
jgi:hypothetical protein